MASNNKIYIIIPNNHLLYLFIFHIYGVWSSLTLTGKIGENAWKIFRQSHEGKNIHEWLLQMPSKNPSSILKRSTARRGRSKKSSVLPKDCQLHQRAQWLLQICEGTPGLGNRCHSRTTCHSMHLFKGATLRGKSQQKINADSNRSWQRI